MITVYTLLGLTFIIFIHEMGHFLLARWCGVQVYTFSIGFGPRILTFYRDQKGTEYILSLIPLGGYVRMKGQEDIPSKNEGESHAATLESDHFLSKKPWQRLLIILAGVKMNLLSAFVFIIIAFMIGIPFSSNVIGGFLPNSPASSLLRVGDEIVEVNGEKTDTMEEIITAVALQGQKDTALLKVLRREGDGVNEVATELDLSGSGKIPNLGIIPKFEYALSGLTEDSSLYQRGLRNGFILDEVIPLPNQRDEQGRIIAYKGNSALIYIERNPGKMIDLRYRDGEEVVLNSIKLLEQVEIAKKTGTERGFYFSPRIQVIENYPAYEAGLENEDLILSINGEPILYWEEIIYYLQRSGQGQSIEVRIKRGEDVQDYSVFPYFDSSRGNYILGITAFIDSQNQGQEVSYITPAMEKAVPGIRVGDILVNHSENQGLISVEVIRDGNRVSFTYEQSQMGEKVVGHLFDYTLQGKNIRYPLTEAIPASFSLVKQEFSEVLSFFYLLVKGQLPLEVMGGPIAIFEVSHQVAESKGWSYFLLLLAKISISLVILNLLPIPVLDGGHACVIFYEMVRRKPVPEKFLRFFQMVGIVFLLILIIYVNYNDINQILKR